VGASQYHVHVDKLLAWISWFFVRVQMVGSTHPHFKEEIDRGRDWMNRKRKVL
jgi:hypothetical protein